MHFLCHCELELWLESKLELGVVLKGCKCGVIGSGGRSCLLHAVVLLKFFN
jgi:hypothetical protein